MARRRWEFVMMLWLGILAFVYPIPHTIALRNLLLVAGLLFCVFRMFRNEPGQQPPRLPVLPYSALVLLLVLSAWMAFQSTFISRHSEEALQLMRGDWLVVLLVGLIGGWFAARGGRTTSSALLGGFSAALFVHVLWLLGYLLFFLISTGRYPQAHELTPFAQRDYHSSLFTMLTALLLAEVMARVLKRRSLLPISMRFLLLGLGINLLATMLIQTRNAVLITIALLVACAWLLIREKSTLDARVRRLSSYAAIVAGCVALGGIANDFGRWKQFFETAKVAVDTREHLSWRNLEKYPLPRMSNGNPVEVSAYSRIAWGKVALEQIVEHPLGVGFGHKAFGWAVNDAYGLESGLESSHSGLLDFTLANGLPGLVLWLAFSSALIGFGLRHFRRCGSPAGLMLALSVFGYFVRCALDGHLSGWRLEMYGLIVGVLMVLAAKADEREPGAS